MRYEKYKQTGTKWITSIPVSWDMQKIGALFVQRKEKVSDKDFAPISVTKNGILPQLATAAKTDDGDNRKKVCVGDFVINSRSDRKGSCGVSDLEGSVSLINIVLQPREQLSGKYAHYLLRNHLFSEEYYRNGRGIVADLWTTRYSEMKTILLPVPPREEQEQIVRYLDWQVSKINRLIAAKRKRIELVKEHFSVRIANIVCNGLKPNIPMRETGIDYIGAIPSHWTVLQNKRLFKSMNRTFQGIPTVLSLSQKDGLIPYSEMTERSLHTSSYENWQLVCPNDLVLNRFKAHLGVFFASKYTGIVTFHYGVYEAKMPLVAKYYEVLYHTPEYCRIYAGQSRGMTVGLQNLSDTNFYSTYTVYPPNEEQREIVTEIEQIEKQQSSIIAGVNRQIEKLQEFRTRLISDVVTGQIDVRGIKVPDDEYINNEITEEEFEEESENNEEE